jgi:hypothetical protein
VLVTKSPFGRQDEIELRWRGHQARTQMSKQDGALLASMTHEPEIVLHIAQRLHRDVMDVERDLYRLAGIRPGQRQPEGTGQVHNHRADIGVPVKWSLPVEWSPHYARVRLLLSDVS